MIYPFNFQTRLREHSIVKVELENSTTSIRFITFLSISTLLATLGLLADNTPVLVGSMLIAPLMSVTVALGVGISLFNKKLIFTSVSSIIMGSVISIMLSTLLVSFLPTHVNTIQIAERFVPDTITFLVAVISGIAAGLILLWENEVQVVAGASIATTLIPPLAATGIAISTLNTDVAIHTLYMYILNLIGVVIGAIISFYFLVPAQKQ